MSYPPDGCTYQVFYPDGLATVSASFEDEFAMGAWFVAKEAAGEIDRTSRGLTVFSVTDDGRQAIDIMHPRLVRGRMERHPA